jgi:hypothetical protein
VELHSGARHGDYYYPEPVLTGRAVTQRMKVGARESGTTAYLRPADKGDQHVTGGGATAF